jgi:hypothetical protein
VVVLVRVRVKHPRGSHYKLIGSQLSSILVI